MGGGERGVLLYDPRQIAKTGKLATCRKCRRVPNDSPNSVRRAVLAGAVLVVLVVGGSSLIVSPFSRPKRLTSGSFSSLVSAVIGDQDLGRRVDMGPQPSVRRQPNEEGVAPRLTSLPASGGPSPKLDPGDPTVQDRDVAYRGQILPRVDHPAARNQEIVGSPGRRTLLGRGKRRSGERKRTRRQRAQRRDNRCRSEPTEKRAPT